MFVVIVTEQINRHDSRTCDLLETQSEAMEFARSTKRDLLACGRSGTIDVYQLDAESRYTYLTARSPAKPTRKRGCRR